MTLVLRRYGFGPGVRFLMSTPAREIELKLRVPIDCWDRLRAHPLFSDRLKRPISQQTLVSVYFDLDDLYLRKHGMNLRVRHIGDRRLQTLEIEGARGAYFERTEIEQELSGDSPSLDFAVDDPAIQSVAADIRTEVQPMFETQVERTSFRIDGADADIEVALERGQILGNGSAEPISEIELELKRGRPADLFDLARSISAMVPVELATESKAERGYALIDPDGRRPKADSVSLDPASSVADAFKAIAHSCLRQIAASAPAVRRRESDAVHQMRVGMRRLRAALSLFSGVVRDGESEQIKKKLKHYAAELGPARDLEVMIVDVLRPFSRRYAGEKGFASLIRSFTRRRKQAYDRAVQTVASDDFGKFTIACAAWIEAGEWAARYEPGSATTPAWPATIYAGERIARQRKKLLRRARHLAGLQPAEVHALRIRAKKLRYTAEFFQSLYADQKKAKRCKRFVAKIQALQDALGTYNDVVVRRRIFLEFTAGPQARKNPGIAFAAGQIVGEQRAGQRQRLKRAAKALAALQDVKPFWKIDQPLGERNGSEKGAATSSEDMLEADAA
jgi:inorganic triphosphatase YgiF